MRTVSLIFVLVSIANGKREKDARGRGRPESATESPPKPTSFLEGASEYDAWRAVYRAAKEYDPVPYEVRLEHFLSRKAAVEAHNAQVGMPWTEKLNHLADWTPDEYKALLGHRPDSSRWGAGSSSVSSRQSSPSFLQVQPERKEEVKPEGHTTLEEVDWRKTYAVSSAEHTKEQKACGSCWAAATAGVLEWYAEMDWKRRLGTYRPMVELTHLLDSMWNPEEVKKEGLVSLSIDYLVDCAFNKRRCGGDGGCRGFTAEGAFAAVLKNLTQCIPPEREYAELGGHGDSQGVSEKDSDKKCREPRCGQHGVQIESFETLPRNEQQPLMDAVVNSGPIVVSVDAGPWSGYDGGVFARCKPNTVVNHAVILVGYGEGMVKLSHSEEKQNLKYWIIRNSWGSTWGEDGGYIRLIRYDTPASIFFPPPYAHVKDLPTIVPAALKGERKWGDALPGFTYNEAENKYVQIDYSKEGKLAWLTPPADNPGFCGLDMNNKEGVGCDGEPDTVIVCGACGILADSAYPKGVTLLGVGDSGLEGNHHKIWHQDQDKKKDGEKQRLKAHFGEDATRGLFEPSELRPTPGSAKAPDAKAAYGETPMTALRGSIAPAAQEGAGTVVRQQVEFHKVTHRIETVQGTSVTVVG